MMNTNSSRKPDWVIFSIPVSQTIAQCFGTFSSGIQYCWSHIELMYPLKVLTFFLNWVLRVRYGYTTRAFLILNEVHLLPVQEELYKRKLWRLL